MIHWFGVAVMFFLLAVIVGAGVVVARAVIKPTSLLWHLAAVLPVVPLAVAATGILVGVSRDPTAHNLWPFEILIFSVIGAVLLGLLFVTRTIRSRRA